MSLLILGQMSLNHRFSGLSECFGNFKHNVCMKNDELLEYELNDESSLSVSPWRTYDCGSRWIYY